MSHRPGDPVVKDSYLECGDGTRPVPHGTHGHIVDTTDRGLLHVDFGDRGVLRNLPTELVTALMSIPCPIPKWVARGQPDDDGSDFAAVDQALQGWWTAAELYPEDRLAAVAEMWRLGWSQADTAERLYTSKKQVEGDRQHLRYLARKQAGWFR